MIMFVVRERYLCIFDGLAVLVFDDAHDANATVASKKRQSECSRDPKQ